MQRHLIIFAILIIILISCSGTPVTNFEIPLSLIHDTGYYLRSTGGKTKNGCEAWATSLKSGEYLYVGKCDVERLKELRFNIQDALEFSTTLPLKQQIVESSQYHMIDYTNIKQQALFGYTSNRCLVHIILNENQEVIYFRLDGDVSGMKESEIPIDALMKQNDTLSEEYKIIPDHKDLSYIRDVKTGRQYLIGKNARSIKTAIMFDGKQKTLGYKKLNQ